MAANITTARASAAPSPSTSTVDISSPIVCNCSRCQRLGSVLAFTRRTSFTLLRGEDALTEYTASTATPSTTSFCNVSARHRVPFSYATARRDADGRDQLQLPRRRRRAAPCPARPFDGAGGPAMALEAAATVTYSRPVRSDARRRRRPSELARDFFAYMRATYPENDAAIDAYLVIQDFEGQLADFRDHFTPPHGECLLARLDGAPVGVVMLKPYSPGVCELNRMYVADAARGRGVGRGALRGPDRPGARARLPRDPPRRPERAGRGAAALPQARLPPRSRPAGLRPHEPGVISLRMPL